MAPSATGHSYGFKTNSNSMSILVSFVESFAKEFWGGGMKISERG